MITTGLGVLVGLGVRVGVDVGVDVEVGVDVGVLLGSGCRGVKDGFILGSWSIPTMIGVGVEGDNGRYLR
jgi:hypothetical protein